MPSGAHSRPAVAGPMFTGKRVVPLEVQDVSAELRRCGPGTEFDRRVLGGEPDDAGLEADHTGQTVFEVVDQRDVIAGQGAEHGHAQRPVPVVDGGSDQELGDEVVVAQPAYIELRSVAESGRQGVVDARVVLGVSSPRRSAMVEALAPKAGRSTRCGALMGAPE